MQASVVHTQMPIIMGLEAIRELFFSILYLNSTKVKKEMMRLWPS